MHHDIMVYKLKGGFFMSDFNLEGSVTFQELCRKWQDSIRYSVKESSFACYDTLVRTHLIPWFSRYGIEEISTDLIYQFSSEKARDGLSPKTVKELLILLQAILRLGEQNGDFSLRGIRIYFPKTGTAAINVMSEDHVQRLIDALEQRQGAFAAGLLLCLYTGIREGELCGLQWQDFDFGREILHIRRTVSRIKNMNYHEGMTPPEPKTCIHISSPKSASSVRDIPIPDFLLPRLQAELTEPGDFILTGSKHCMEPRRVQNKFHALLEEADIPQINFHSLRHAFATRFTQIGFDSKTLSEILGHSSPKITMDIYVHSSMPRKKNCLNQMYY
jgi:integrase